MAWNPLYGATASNSIAPGANYVDPRLAIDQAARSKMEQRVDPSRYNASLNYQDVVAPFLGQGQTQTQAGGAISNLLTNPSNVRRAGQITPDTSNPYESRLMSLLNSPDSIANTGAYKFALGEGQKALERSAAAKGMLGSGNTLAALTKYGQGMASQQYGTEMDRLAALTGQQQRYILGQQQNAISGQQADTQQYGAESSRLGTLGDLLSSGTAGNVAQGRLALDAAGMQSGDYWNAQKMANQWYQNTPIKAERTGRYYTYAV